MSELTQTIKELYQGNISDGEVELAKDNVLGFFKLLQEIDIRLQREQIQSTPTRTKSSKSNKSQNANIGN
jgi:hypothetical protein